MKSTVPYFQTNEDWFTYDLEKGKFFLTDAGKAIPEVVKSYEDFYSKRSDEETELPPAIP